MAANYNNSAWFYDRLSKLVYGNALINAQVYLLKHILPGSNILIVGGGTGSILEAITNIHPSGLKIIYVEVSANMTALSMKRSTGQNEVRFMNTAIENAAIKDCFDVVITPFLFDNFKEDTFENIFTTISKLIAPDGIWLNTDFQLTGKWWQNGLLKTMFIFFKLWCGIEASKLPDIEKYFEENNYKAIDQKTFFGDFIVSKAYRLNRD